MIENLKDEIWVDIASYEGVYQVSNMGRVKSLHRKWNCGHRGSLTRQKGEKLLKFNIDKQGYLRVNFCKEGKQSYRLVHRLVAIAFISNPENKPEVNHKHGIKNDNRVTELEWHTPHENMQHAHKIGIKKGTFGGRNGLAKIVLDTATGVYYDCLKEAAMAKGVDYGRLSKQLSGNAKNKTSMLYV